LKNYASKRLVSVYWHSIVALLFSHVQFFLKIFSLNLNRPPGQELQKPAFVVLTAFSLSQAAVNCAADLYKKALPVLGRNNQIEEASNFTCH
jgi:hypothetical protein